MAVLVDVDGTLVGPYRNGIRELRQSAVAAISLLSSQAPVYLWSVAGAANGDRLIDEFPALAPLVAGCWAKDEFPLHLVDCAWAIDDDGIDEAVLRCNHVILGESYEGGQDSDLLLEAARAVVDALRAWTGARTSQARRA